METIVIITVATLFADTMSVIGFSKSSIHGLKSAFKIVPILFIIMAFLFTLSQSLKGNLNLTNEVYDKLPILLIISVLGFFSYFIMDTKSKYDEEVRAEKQRKDSNQKEQCRKGKKL